MGYTQQEQVEIVRDAMILTATIEYEEKKLEELKKLEFGPMPAEPVRKVVKQPGRVEPQMPPLPPLPVNHEQYYNKRIIVATILGLVPIVLGVIIFLVWGLFSYTGLSGVKMWIDIAILAIIVTLPVTLLIYYILWGIFGIGTIKSGWQKNLTR